MLLWYYVLYISNIQYSTYPPITLREGCVQCSSFWRCSPTLLSLFMLRGESGRTPVYFYLCAVWLPLRPGPKPFLIWWWAVKWPACPHDWVAAARVGFQGFPYRSGLFGLGEWYCTHTHLPHLRYTQALSFEQPWHCSAHPPCPWVSWDARNNWWRCRVMLSVQAGQQTPLTNPLLRGNVLLPPFTLIVLNSPLFHRDLPFNRCH